MKKEITYSCQSHVRSRIHSNLLQDPGRLHRSQDSRCLKHLLGDPHSPLEMYIAWRQTSTSSPMRLVRSLCSWQGYSSAVGIPVKGAPSQNVTVEILRITEKRVLQNFPLSQHILLCLSCSRRKEVLSPQLLLLLPFISLCFYWCCYSCFLLKH